ncbi:hypothetical protein BJX63DRAFT_428487 [Aspergillus granulosus]|uniref:Uncharacterized protein n=1 Tax=Aspergillus granulosus TaxID=176169 RepID=A0ABR4HWC7_9EURO
MSNVPEFGSLPFDHYVIVRVTRCLDPGVLSTPSSCARQLTIAPPARQNGTPLHLASVEGTTEEGIGGAMDKARPSWTAGAYYTPLYLCLYLWLPVPILPLRARNKAYWVELTVTGWISDCTPLDEMGEDSDDEQEMYMAEWNGWDYTPDPAEYL